MAFTQIVSSQTVTSETVSYGTQTIAKGGSANNTTISYSGYQNISSGGTANFTTISSGGSQALSSGGVANGTMIQSGGSQNVSYGGIADSTTINSYGSQYVYGVATSTTINSHGAQFVYGVVTSTTVNSDGEQYVNGTANCTAINSGGCQIVSGGTAISTTINASGYQYIYRVASQSLIQSGGIMMIGNGGSATGFTMSSGGILGWDFNAVFSGTSNGVAVASSSGKTSYNLYLGNLTQNVSSGYTADSTTLGLNAHQYVSSGGVANNTNIQSYSAQYVSSGGTANITTIDSGSYQFVIGGTATSTTINSRGSQGVTSGGIANLTTVNSGGNQVVTSGGIANSTTVNSGGSQGVTSGGIANLTTVNSGGNQIIYDATVNNTVIGFGGRQYIYGGTASDTVINSGANQYVSSGGTARNATINSGGNQYVSSGGNLVGNLTIAGGHAVVKYSTSLNLSAITVKLEHAATNDALMVIQSGGVSINSATFTIDVNNTANGTYILGSGGDLTGIRNATFIVTHNDLNISLKTGSSYIFTNGDKVSLNFNDSATDQLTATISEIIAPSTPESLINSIDKNKVSLGWADSMDTSGIKQYDVQIDGNADFSSPEYKLSSVSNSADITGMADGIYYWRVRAQDNESNLSKWTSGGSFTVDITPPSTPSALTRNISGSSVALDWADAIDSPAGVNKYEVQVDNNNNFSSPEYTASPVGSSASYSGLSEGCYYWRVRTQDNSDNFSAWASGASFVCDMVGNNITGALLLSNPSTTGWVGLGDAGDFYKLTMSNAGTMTLGLTGLTGNANLTLLDAKGVQLKASSNSGIANESIVQMLLAGDYYVKVAPAFGVNDVAYTLTHAEKYCPADTAANTWQTAKNIDDGVDNWVGFGDSADFYKLTMTNAGTLTLGLTGLTGNADMSLLNSAGTLLKSSAKTGTADEAISNVLLLAGTYYVKVAPATGVNDANYSLAHTEKYTPVDKAANDYKTALDISTLDNWVGFGDTADFYKLTMTNAGMLTLGLTGLTGNADLTLLNAGGMQLKTSSNTGITSEAITNVALLAGIYYVKVATGYGVNDAGYTLAHTEKYTPADTGANTWQTAKQIDDGVDNWVGFGDTADFYKLTMTNAGMFSLGLTGLTGNADLTLLNAGGMQLKASSSTGTTSEAINNVALLAGTYYVKVAAGTSVNDAAYTLTHTEKYCPADKAANDYKTALDISNLDNWVGFGDTADFYKLTMTNAGTLTLGLTGLTGNADLALLNSAGTALKTSANAGTANEAINNVSLLAGTYYVKVATGYGVNDASYNLSNTVSYFPGDTSDKAGNTPAAAKLVDSPTQTGWVGFGDSDDYYKFDLATAAQGTLRLYDLTGGNADLTLYDAKGVQLQKSAKTGALEDTITRNLAAGTYYARVNAVSGNIDYKLDFSKKDGYGMLAS